MRTRINLLTFSFLCSALFTAGALAADSAGEPGLSSGTKNPLNNVYFGEQHLHTQDSPDVFAMGTRNSQDDAYKFCKGKPIKKSTGGGYTVQKKTPYDWCAVTDHAVMMGLLPMTLAKPARAKAPTFAVWALKDPDSGNLDRIQIIKGWYKNGYPWEKIYDVAWSDGRKPAGTKGEVVKIVSTDGVHVSTNYHTVPPGKLPPVGNTVDVKNASYTNTIGDTQLSAVWTDPDFDPSQHAVYYVRVLEIPTPRWSTYDAKALGITPPAVVPATIQERAWASPIWYTPDASVAKKAIS